MSEVLMISDDGDLVVLAGAGKAPFDTTTINECEICEHPAFADPIDLIYHMADAHPCDCEGNYCSCGTMPGESEDT